ncbi:PQQ-binding-like beta-propeller repeat protein [Sphingosinicella microcystinivorans]|uniref:outer membrane protein assembly factor BamB family protein n=1 Tax=Sphingosinicella microcystinivorans TaxID=335406 RepID=UPI0022F3F033|nr:PQQ-binding-like beta-propeller repeat protein [Sphingosinicella microcystinivorans]WBX83762.1 PQQ-binding-like beta-propeller repeat protein [Sphingosinicella microcystinivorans]
MTMRIGRLLVLSLAVSAAGWATPLPTRDKLEAESEISSWPGYNGSYAGQRHVDLNQINPDNVASLAEVCRVRVGGVGVFHAGPVLVDGRLFVTTIRETIALDPTDCSVLWKSVYVPDEKETWNTNRGVAVWNGRLFRGTGDARLVAYDAATGRELWRTAMADPTSGAWVAAAPIAWNGIVFTSLAGSEWGIRGKMFAVDAMTGKQLWSFNLIPQAGEPGVETWKGTSYETGGGGSWSSYALDPDASEVFVPVANPAPDFDAERRKGDNLYTGSIVALDARTGKYKWHYQGIPNDAYDYGFTTPPMLYTSRNGRSLVAVGSKNGYLYVIDRATHKLAFKQAVTTIRNRGARLSEKPVEICPGALGGMQWNGPALDPTANLMITGSVDYCSTIALTRQPYKRGEFFLSGDLKFIGTPIGHITAMDASGGRVRWQLNTKSPIVSGIITTASGLTFAGDLTGTLYILQTATGRVLRTIETGGAMAGGIISYSAAGKQYVAVTSGNVSRSSLGTTGLPTVIVYALGDGFTTTLGAAPMPAAAAQTQPSPSIAPLFAQTCAQCHGAAGEGGIGPALRNIAPPKTVEEIAQIIRTPPPGMPHLYPDTLTASDVDDLAVFVSKLK